MTAYIGGVNVASFSESIDSYVGQRVDIFKPGLVGHLFLNTDFFGPYREIPRGETSSDMENMAKAFFNMNGKNHVALVQYLCPGGRSREHYHTLREEIAQLAGRSLLEIRTSSDDSKVTQVELQAGESYVLNPYQAHQVKAFDEGSITIPVKQTIAKRKDHFYSMKSDRRMLAEVQSLLQDHYNSGEELLACLGDYHTELQSEEKSRFDLVLQTVANSSSNPNIRLLLGEFSPKKD
jgi:hypothetical protein